VQIDASGRAEVVLPVAVGTNSQSPPALACYTTSSVTAANIAWLAVSDGYTTSTTSFCAMVFRDGRWNAVLSRGIANWFAAFVVVY
jgi:hypothetical protein